MKKIKYFYHFLKINFFFIFIPSKLYKIYNGSKLMSKKERIDYTNNLYDDFLIPEHPILCDEIMISKAINYQIKNNADVTFIKNMPYGTAKEVMNFKTIKMISDQSIENRNTEYLEWFLENSKNFNVKYIKSNYKFEKSMRLTLDFREDLILFDKIFRHFRDKNANFTLKSAIKFLNKNKKLININNFLTPKFKRTEINTELNI